MTEPLQFTEEQKKAYKAVIAPNATPEQWTYFITECERRALIPGTHVVFSVRNANEYDPRLKQSVQVQKVALVTTINALRLIAERSGKFKGYGKFTYYYGDDNGAPTVTSAIPLGRIPHAVSVELFREGWAQPVFAHARFDACVQTKSDGGKQVPTAMWTKRGEEQLAKCAEASGLRIVAPEECGSLYIDEEMGGQQEPVDAVPAAAPTPTVIPPQPTVAPVVNQAAAPAPAAHTAPAPPATPAPAAQATPKPPAPAGPAPKSPPPPPPAARTAPAMPPAAPNPSPVPVAPVAEPVAVTAARVNAQADLVKATFVAGVAEQQTDLTPAEKQEMKGAMERDPDPVATPIVETIPALQVPPGTPVIDAEVPATPTERQTFLNRAAKIVRDTMEGKAKVKEAGAFLRSYFAKQAGVTDLKKITAAKWEQMISELEGIADPMAVAEKVKAGAK